MECKVYMGAVDVDRQALNVFRMKLLGSEVESVRSGSRTLKDAVNEAMRDWVASVESTHYCLGSVMGPHPYPWMVREFHRVLGQEAHDQCVALLGDVPDIVTACVGGGSNAIGIFSGFADTRSRLVGVEPAGGAAVSRGQPGVVHGMRSYLMQDEYGQVMEAESISAGLDYPGVGPEHSYLASIGRAEYPTVTDAEVIEAFQVLASSEGIIAALESAHALAWILREAPTFRGATVLMNLSGRGDKDVAQMMEILGK
jgi:tryptophan synthase beta chain